MLAVHSIHEFAFSVPDLDAAAHFYRSFGLDVRDEAGGLALYTHGHPHRWARILPGDCKRLLWISWGVHADDLPALALKLDQRYTQRLPPPLQSDQPGLWFKGPDGLPQQLVVSEKCTPDHKSARIFPPADSAAGRAPRRSMLQQVRPNRLSHILTFTADVDASMDFYTGVLGLRLSDRSGSVIAFMHSPHGSDHHLLALALSEDYGLHHSSWDVSSFDDIGLGAQQMTEAGYARGWGVGRHVLGSNYFRYVRDPWGGYSEYSFDIDHIAAGLEWPSGDYPPEDSLYVWGETPPDDFTRNYEITAE
ncbi:metapyrocatechase [Duganella sp. FT80W]|uniref:Metapyrocatechase n=1 Tax=Duganella guangzhouensis TaxID=2666084 RepID=A0A6I2L8U2_9BURK|nr:VOC family protein [Duganella guangzhouensis]MRW94661.1 metapyrocatechase [Duganella guangzhouensis]